MIWPKGINGWHFDPGVDWIDAAAEAKAAGFEVIEPIVQADGPLSVHTSEADCRLLGEKIRQQGVTVSSVACGWLGQANFSAEEQQVRDQALAWTVATMQRAQWLGASAVLVVGPFVGHYREPARMITSYEVALNRTYQLLRELAPVGEGLGVVVALENIWNRFLLSPTEARELIDRVNSPWVGLYLDVGNVLAFGYPQDWIRILGQRIVRVHLKDFKLDVGTIEGFCPLGQGDVDWPAVRSALTEVGYAGPVIFEGKGNLSDIADSITRVMG